MPSITIIILFPTDKQFVMAACKSCNNSTTFRVFFSFSESLRPLRNSNCSSINLKMVSGSRKQRSFDSLIIFMSIPILSDSLSTKKYKNLGRFHAHSVNMKEFQRKANRPLEDRRIAYIVNYFEDVGRGMVPVWWGPWAQSLSISRGGGLYSEVQIEQVWTCPGAGRITVW